MAQRRRISRQSPSYGQYWSDYRTERDPYWLQQTPTTLNHERTVIPEHSHQSKF